MAEEKKPLITIPMPTVYDMAGGRVTNVYALLFGADKDSMELIVEGLGKRTLVQLREHMLAKQAEADAKAKSEETKKESKK